MKLFAQLLVTLFALNLCGCETALKPLQIDPCNVLPGRQTCYAVPLNQPGKSEYERALRDGSEDEDGDGKPDLNPDICVSVREFTEAKKREKELIRRCGDRCR